MEYSDLILSVEKLKKCKSTDELKNCFTRIISKLGFQKFAYMRFAHDYVSIDLSIYTYSETWKKMYFKRGYDQIDPIFVQALTENKAFFWSACMPEFTKGVENFFEEAANHGIYLGLTTPLKANAKTKAIMTIVSAKTNKNKYIKETSPAVLALVKTLSESFHQVAIQILSFENYNLKLREKQVITLSSCGMSSPEIAVTLNKSTAYINEIVTNVLHKLGTQTRPAAVRRAIELGLLD